MALTRRNQQSWRSTHSVKKTNQAEFPLFELQFPRQKHRLSRVKPILLGVEPWSMNWCRARKARPNLKISTRIHHKYTLENVQNPWQRKGDENLWSSSQLHRESLFRLSPGRYVTTNTTSFNDAELQSSTMPRKIPKVTSTKDIQKTDILYCWMLSRSTSRMLWSFQPKEMLPREQGGTPREIV